MASRNQRPRRRRRFSLWTLLAPAALVVIVVTMFNSIGHSCVFHGTCGDSKSSVSSTTSTDEYALTSTNGSTSTTPTKRIRPHYTVREGDSLESIANGHDLTVDQLKVCNATKNLVDSYSLQPGDVLNVGPKCHDLPAHTA